MNEKYRERLARVKNHFGSEPLSETEYNYLVSVQNLIKAAQERRMGFRDVLETIRLDLSEILRRECRFEIDAILNEGIVLNVLDELDVLERAEAEGTDVRDATPLSEGESRFLSDISGMIDFAARNGVGFHFPVDIMSHDIKEVLLVHQGSIDRAFEYCFKPKSTGWAGITEDSFGEVEEA